jgi:hypothetical protein
MFRFIVLFFGLSSAALAEEGGVQFKSGDDYSKAAVHLEGNTLVLINSVNLSGEYRALPGMAVSGGFGLGSVSFLGLAKFTNVGGRVMVHGITGKKKGHFESAAGIGIYSWKVAPGVLTKGALGDVEEKLGTKAAPELFIGYRLQPPDGGVLFRIGFAYSHNGPGISSSLGYSF